MKTSHFCETFQTGQGKEDSPIYNDKYNMSDRTLVRAGPYGDKWPDHQYDWATSWWAWTVVLALLWWWFFGRDDIDRYGRR
jgi:hypothetical protein